MRIRLEPSMYMSVLLETRRRLLLTLRLVMIYYEEALSTVPLCLGSSMSASLLALCIACTLRARSGESDEETLWSWNHSAFPYTVAPCERIHQAEKVPEDGTCRKQPASGHMLRDSSWFSP